MGKGADDINGGEGSDRIYAGAGDDTAFGDEGDDKLYLADGADYADGGDGNNPRNVRMRCAANVKSSHHHRPARRMDRRSAARALRRMACTNGFDGVVGLRIAQKRALNETSQQNSVEFLGHGSDKTGFDFCSKEMSWRA